ncbi:MAG TPA: hypothetical protein VH137_05370 [Gemmatimonadales bacterium]|jgi:ferric-dicitrate binding protein FerR (iron transport regulator)|nr:hypothetical protein [Gemmatimonadales bacterium]
MSAYHDDDLKERFGALRREAAAGAPSFQATLAAAQARRPVGRRRWLRLAAAVGLTAALAFLLARRGQPEGGARHAAIDLANVRWHTPTDFLLQLPGDELLRSVPRLGGLTLDRRTL